MCVCAVALLKSTVFIICTLSLTVGQNVTLSLPSNDTDVTRPLVTYSPTSHTDVTLAVTSKVIVPPMTTGPPIHRAEVYLKRTVSYGSPLNLSMVLDVRSSFELSFRTCSHGRLLSQIGGDERNYFQLVLSEVGTLNVNLSSAAASASVLLGANVNDNQYYKFVWTYRQASGNVTISVEQKSTVLDETVLSGSQDLWNMDLTSGSKLQVGDGWFEGCLRDGPQRWFLSAAEVDNSAAEWDRCPTATVCNRTVNGCSSPPCANKNARFDNYHEVSMFHTLLCENNLIYIISAVMA